MRGSTSVGYDQFETSPEAIEQELQPAVCERRLTDRLKTNYSIDYYWSTTSKCITFEAHYVNVLQYFAPRGSSYQ